MTSVDPLKPFGFSLNRLVSLPDGSGVACEQPVAAGSPVLALPLECCYSAWRARQCRAVAYELSAAIARNAELELLRADDTWITLHLLYERSLGREAPTARQAHLQLLRERPPENLLAWERHELAALAASPWAAEAERRKAQVLDDFGVLLQELGPAAAARLGVDEAGYVWARLVLQQYGLHILDPEGGPVTLLVPGLELLLPAASTRLTAECIRAHFNAGELGLGLGSLAISAVRDYAAGERVELAHATFACTSGRRLLACGWALEQNPWEYVEVHLSFRYSPAIRQVVRDLALILEWSSGLPPPRPGDCLEADLIDAWGPVQIFGAGAEAIVSVSFRITQDQPIPGGKQGSALLGLGLLNDPDLLPEIIGGEQEAVDVYGQDQCAGRALRVFRSVLAAQIEAYPREMRDVGTSQASVRPSRKERAAQLLTNERKLLQSSLDAIDEKLIDLAAWQDAALTAGEVFATELQPDSPLGRAVAQLRCCTEALEGVASRFRSLVSQGRLTQDDGRPVQQELQMLRGCLGSSRLSDPGAAAFSSVAQSGDGAIRSHSEATDALFNAVLAGLEWEVAMLRDAAPTASEAAPPCTSLPQALVSKATMQMRLWRFEQAQAELAKALALQPGLRDIESLARDCAMTSAARSTRVLSSPSSGTEVGLQGIQPTLDELRERLAALGYLSLQLPWVERLPVSLPSMLRAAWGEAGEGLEASLAGRSKGARAKLIQLVRLFCLREPLPLAQVADLLGTEATALLLQWSGLSAYRGAEGRMLAPGEAMQLLSAVPRGGRTAREALRMGSGAADGGVELFASMALLPVEGLLIAADFDASIGMEGGEETVLYPAEDTRALLVGAKDLPVTPRILDVRCGNGVLGLVALKRYAGHATFLDSNMRGLRFARFSAALNGLGAKATFIQGSFGTSAEAPAGLEGPFDAVLAALPCLPNPSGIVTSLGPMYPQGTAVDEDILATLVSKCAHGLLQPKGWLAATVVAAVNIDTWGRRLVAWADAAPNSSGLRPADVRAVLLHGEPQAAESLLRPLQACTALELEVYSAALHRLEVRTIAPAMILLCACPSDATMRRDQRVVVRSAGLGFWSDQSCVEAELQRSRQELFSIVSAGELLAQSEGDEELLYCLEWDAVEPDSDVSESASRQPLEMSAATPKFYESTVWARRARRPAVDRAGLSWEDARSLAIMGWAPPILCDVLWKETPRPEIRDKLIKEQVALLELKGCRLSGPAEKALRKGLGFTARYSFDGKPRKFQLLSGGLNDGYKGPVAGTDVLIVPIPPDAYADAPLDALPTEVVKLVQQVATIMETEKRLILVMFVTSGASGPMFTTSQSRPPAAAAMRGVIRVARLELQSAGAVPLICLDTDALSVGAQARQLVTQIACELEATDGTMEVAYRNGVRYAPRMQLGSRNRIRPGQVPPALPWTSEAGVALITGGLGGLGIVTAEALVEAGCACVVLAGRSGKVRKGQGLEERFEALSGMGAAVLQEKCDTASEREVVALLGRIRMLGPLRIVIHAAGILDDRMFFRHDADSMRRSFAPKADGAWYLHKHTLQDPVESFLCYSSIAANFGHPGQANYASSNTYMDSLCTWRVAHHLPGISVQWPGVREVGMSAELTERDGGGQASVTIAVVKQTVKQLVAGSGPVEPIQAVCPTGFLVPRLRQHASMLQLLLEPFISGLRISDGKVQCRVLGTGDYVSVPDGKELPAGEIASLYKPSLTA